MQNGHTVESASANKPEDISRKRLLENCNPDIWKYQLHNNMMKEDFEETSRKTILFAQKYTDGGQLIVYPVHTIKSFCLQECTHINGKQCVEVTNSRAKGL